MPAEARSWGGRRSGAGRKPKAQQESNGHHLAGPTVGPRVTFGQMFASVPATPPPANANAQTPAPAPGPGPAAPAAPAPERPGNRSFANLVGYVSANIGVAFIGDHLKKKGFEPHEPPPEDVERTAEATADAVAVAIGDAEIPWWAVVVASWGNLYLAMRVGAKRTEPESPAPVQAVRPSPSAPDPAPSPLGMPVTKPPPAPPIPRGGQLPEIPIIGVP